MSGKKRYKGNPIGETYLAVPISVLNSPLFLALTPFAVKLLLDVGEQYRGHNNGDLAMAWKLMKPRGWRSEATLHKAKRELLDAGFLYETRMGRRPNVCSLFALTWRPLDKNDKFDPGVAAGFTRGEFRFKAPLKVIARAGKHAAPTSHAVVARAA